MRRPRLTSTALLLASALAPVAGRAETAPPASEPDTPVCAIESASAALGEGMALQRSHDSKEAADAYRRCLRMDPQCTACVYELGWSHAAMGEWSDSVRLWERVLEMEPAHEEAAFWLPKARVRARTGTEGDVSPIRMALGTTSFPREAPVRLTLVARIRNWRLEDPPDSDLVDPELFSPKSVRFLPNRNEAWINALEGYRTLVYEAKTRKKIGSIRHTFSEKEAAIFQGMQSPLDYRIPDLPGLLEANHFSGKPVETTFSPEGKLAWIPYYRRSWDRWGAAPSAVAIVETDTKHIVRVLPTGPIPKFVALSPDGRRAAIVHWGDNTVAFVDTSSGDPADFRYVAHGVVEERLPLDELAGVDRDRDCGYCLRGAVFTPDGSRLLVARMGGGGIAGFEVETGRYLGTVLGMKPTPRHLVLSSGGDDLFVSSNLAGYVSRIDLDTFLAALERAGARRVPLDGWKETEVGSGARTIEISPDGRWVFAAVYSDAEVVVLDASSMDIVARVRTDAYPVGLDVSPDGKEVWVTAQGRLGQGGNSVTIYELDVAGPGVNEPADRFGSTDRLPGNRPDH